MVVFAIISYFVAMLLWWLGKFLFKLGYAGLVSAGVLAGGSASVGTSLPADAVTVLTPKVVDVPVVNNPSPNLTPTPTSPSISSAKVTDAADAEFEF